MGDSFDEFMNWAITNSIISHEMDGELPPLPLFVPLLGDKKESAPVADPLAPFNEHIQEMSAQNDEMIRNIFDNTSEKSDFERTIDSLIKFDDSDW